MKLLYPFIYVTIFSMVFITLADDLSNKKLAVLMLFYGLVTVMLIIEKVLEIYKK